MDRWWVQAESMAKHILILKQKSLKFLPKILLSRDSTSILIWNEALWLDIVWHMTWLLLTNRSALYQSIMIKTISLNLATTSYPDLLYNCSLADALEGVSHADVIGSDTRNKNYWKLFCFSCSKLSWKLSKQTGPISPLI